jgi:hypothetical protein
MVHAVSQQSRPIWSLLWNRSPPLESQTRKTSFFKSLYSHRCWIETSLNSWSTEFWVLQLRTKHSIKWAPCHVSVLWCPVVHTFCWHTDWCVWFSRQLNLSTFGVFCEMLEKKIIQLRGYAHKQQKKPRTQDFTWFSKSLHPQSAPALNSHYINEYNSGELYSFKFTNSY